MISELGWQPGLVTPKPRQGRVTATFKQCGEVKSLVFRIILISLARPVRANVGLKVKKSKAGQQGFKSLPQRKGKRKGSGRGRTVITKIFFKSNTYQYWWEEKNEERMGGGD